MSTRTDAAPGGARPSGGAGRSLAERQAELVRSLVAGGPVPAGFDAGRVSATADALLRKRAGEVARHWPGLLGTAERRRLFRNWARTRPRRGSFADGFAYAESLAPAARRTASTDGPLDRRAAAELAVARLGWRLGPSGEVLRRRWFGFSVGRCGGNRAIAVGWYRRYRYWQR